MIQNNKSWKTASVIACVLMLQACDSDPNISVTSIAFEAPDNTTPIPTASEMLSTELRQAILVQSHGVGLDWVTLPQSDDLNAIPQDPNNPLTANKAVLGQMLFHDTALATNGHSEESHSWSCASCHHAAAGFKAGVPQGIGEGGVGFGMDGSERVLSESFDAMADNDAPNKPDIQPVATPTVLNTAYQDVMLWNGQFGNSVNGSVNQGIPDSILATVDTPKQENAHQLSGLEIQAIAGLNVHRLDVEGDSVLQTNPAYQAMFDLAYPAGSTDVHVDAGKAIAAFERTVLANQAPFQLWLNGDANAMSDAEKRGGVLFFGKAGCADCHRGPALSSEVGAAEDQMFMAIGLNDFSADTQDLVHGPIADADKQGRGGFTNEAADMYKFKIPQLYNLADTNVLGHGASFTSIRELLEYKNAAIAQNLASVNYLDKRFIPLQMSSAELDDLELFLSDALYDSQLIRYQPSSVPSGECIIVDPKTVETHGLCSP